MSYSDDYVSVDLAITFVILDTLNIFLIDWLIDYSCGIYDGGGVTGGGLVEASINSRTHLFEHTGIWQSQGFILQNFIWGGGGVNKNRDIPVTYLLTYLNAAVYIESIPNLTLTFFSNKSRQNSLLEISTLSEIAVP